MGRPKAESGPLVPFPQGPVPGQDSIYFLWLLKAVMRINENWCKMLRNVSLPAPTSSLSMSQKQPLWGHPTSLVPPVEVWPSRLKDGRSWNLSRPPWWGKSMRFFLASHFFTLPRLWLPSSPSQPLQLSWPPGKGFLHHTKQQTVCLNWHCLFSRAVSKVWTAPILALVRQIWAKTHDAP